MDANEANTPVDATTKGKASNSPTKDPQPSDQESLSGIQKWKKSVRSCLTRNIWGNDGRQRDHIPDMPVWVALVRITQLMLAIATLALTSYGIATMQHAVGYRRLTNWGGNEGYPFTWFVFSWTCVYSVYLSMAVMFIPVMYNCWVNLGLEILTLVFWLITTSLLASHADDLDAIDGYVTGLGPSYRKYYQDFIQQYARGFVDATFAAMATAALNFALFILTVIFFGRALHNHRVKTTPKESKKSKESTSPASDSDKIAASPHVSTAMPAYPRWAEAPCHRYPHPHHYGYYGPPYPPPHAASTTPNRHFSMPPHSHHYMPAYFPPPTNPNHLTYHHYQQRQQEQQHQQQSDPKSPDQQRRASYSTPPDPIYTPWAPHHSPYFGSPGSIWPQHSYAMYQQQVPIAAQHTGESQPGFGSPQFPMVAPVSVSKADLHGVGGTESTPLGPLPPSTDTVSPTEPPGGGEQQHQGLAELNEAVARENETGTDGPAELEHHTTTPAQGSVQ